MGAEGGVPEGLEDDVETAWQTVQQDLATISTNARLVVADGSGTTSTSSGHTWSSTPIRRILHQGNDNG